MQNKISVVQYRGDNGDEDELLVVNKSPSQLTPGQPNQETPSTPSTIEKAEADQNSPLQTKFSPSSYE